jgi:GWxTD domain-containing protein
MISLRHLRLFLVTVGLSCFAAAAHAQEKPPDRAAAQQMKRAKALRDKDKFNLLSPYFKSWLNEDALFLISAEGRRRFLDLASDEERSEFIGQFWRNRSQDPDGIENVFEEEYYRRFLYANQHFGGHWEGWKTDRGRLYIMLGPPDEIDSYPAHTSCFDPAHSNETTSDAPARITWKYRNLYAKGEDFDVWFAQGEFGTMEADESTFQFSMEPCRFVPRPIEGGVEGIFAAVLTAEEKYRDFDLADNSPSAVRQGHPKNRDLEALLNSRVQRTQFPLQVLFDEHRATKITSVRVAIPSNAKHTIASAAIYERFMNKATGEIEAQFELSVFPIRSETRSPEWIELCDKYIPLQRGKYELQIAVKDAATGEVATHYSEVLISDAAN